MEQRLLVDVDVVAEGLAFPEGPVALADGSLLVVETLGGRLTRVGTDGATEVIALLGGGPNGAAIGPDGAVYVCNNGGMSRESVGTPGIQRVELDSGRWSWLYRDVDGHAFGAPNDLVFDGHGGFWFTDFLAGQLHYATADGSGVCAVAKATDPNGIGLSPDGQVLYWAQTSTRQVFRRRISAPGELATSAGASVVSVMRTGSIDSYTLLAGLPGLMELDSLAVDSSGAICVGTLIDGGITEIPGDLEAHSAAERHTLAGVVHWRLPDHLDDGMVTNICFGGPDLTTAYLTCSQHGRLVRCTWPRPGLPLAHTA